MYSNLNIIRFECDTGQKLSNGIPKGSLTKRVLDWKSQYQWFSKIVDAELQCTQRKRKLVVPNDGRHVNSVTCKNFIHNRYFSVRCTWRSLPSLKRSTAWRGRLHHTGGYA